MKLNKWLIAILLAGLVIIVSANRHLVEKLIAEIVGELSDKEVIQVEENIFNNAADF